MVSNILEIPTTSQMPTAHPSFRVNFSSSVIFSNLNRPSLFLPSFGSFFTEVNLSFDLKEILSLAKLQRRCIVNYCPIFFLVRYWCQTRHVTQTKREVYIWKYSQAMSPTLKFYRRFSFERSVLVQN